MRKVKQIVKQPDKSAQRTTRKNATSKLNFGAGDGTRTRDSLLGGQELYQLSYSRVSFPFYLEIPALSKRLPVVA
jgi:hypothetical protein